MVDNNIGITAYEPTNNLSDYTLGELASASNMDTKKG